MKAKNIFIGVIALFVVGISIIAARNFKIPVFYLDDYLYKRESVNGNEITYYSKKAKESIKITDKNEYKEINIYGEIYKVYGQPAENYSEDSEDMMRFEYPDGTVDEGICLDNGIFFRKDENEELQLDANVEVYVGNNKINNDYGKYRPSKLVTIAFEEHKSKNGEPVQFILGIFLLVFGLINIKFYKFFFYLQNTLWVKDPEPTEAYKAVSIGGGIVVCVIGMIFMIANCGQL